MSDATAMDDHPAPALQNAGARYLRQGGVCLGLALLVLATVRLLAFQGWLRPIRIAGGSMAEAFAGPHYALTCADCGFAFRCGAEYLPESEMAVCPNCGYAHNLVEAAAVLPGQRVLIDRWPPWLHGPQIWQAVAVMSSHEAGYRAVKRVVAAGGGRVEIRGGNVFVDGRIQRKSLAQLRQVSMLVHDDHFRPARTAGLPPRWQGAGQSTHWSATSTGYAFTPPAAAAVPHFDWLEYTHWTCWPNPSPPVARTAATPILDHYGYNQNLARGTLNQVSDVMLQCELKLRGSGRVAFRLDDSADRFQLELAYPQRNARLTHNGHPVWQSSRPGSRQPWGVEFAVCDHQVLAAINGVTLLQYPYQPARTSRREISAPVAVGTVGLQCQLAAPKVYRDVYYLERGGRPDAWSGTSAGSDKWFLLGDNVPVSIDSRRDGPVGRESILGSVFKMSK